MKTNSLARLKRKRYYLMEKLKKIDHFIRGSITTIKHKCSNKNCNCQHGGDKHPGLYFSSTINGKTKLIYLGENKKNNAVLMKNNFSDLKKLLDDIVAINIDILKLEN